MEDGTEYEKAASRIGTAGAAQAGSAPIAIDLDDVLAKRIDIRRVDYAEVQRLLELIEAKKAAEEAEAASKQRVQKNVEIGKKLMNRGVTEAEKELGRAAGLLEKEFGESSKGRAIAAKAAMELGRVARSVEKEFGEVVKRDSTKVKANGLVMPGLSLQDQLSELEQIDAGLDKGAFDAGQKKTIISEILGLEATAAKEGASFAGEDQKGLVELRAQRIRDIKSKLNIK